MRIGIFGGSFNPPHNMHENIALELLNKSYLDKVIFVPTGTKYEYKNNLISNEDRYEMLKILTEKNPNLLVSSFEFRERVVYTYETLAHFKEEYPQDEIYFVCGTDNLSYLDKWKNGLSILTNYPIIVVKRETDDLEPILLKYQHLNPNITVANINPKSISSTEIRELIKKDDPALLKEHLDQNVIDYIFRKRLYH